MFCNEGSSPVPSRGTAPATWANGDDTKLAIPAKKTVMAPMTAATHGISSRLRCRFWRSAMVAAPVSTSSQRSSEPSWLAHSDVIV